MIRYHREGSVEEGEKEQRDIKREIFFCLLTFIVDNGKQPSDIFW